MEHEPEKATPETPDEPDTSETMELTEPVEPVAAPPPPAPSVTKTQPSRRKRILTGLAIFVALALVAGQAYVIVALTSTQDDIAGLENRITDVSESLVAVDTAVSGLSDDIALASAAASVPNDTGVSPAPAVPAGFLPRFEAGDQDTALGMTMAPVTATEAYTQEAMNVDPADGTKRVWLIWAHWCPYCQQELPDLAQWWPENADRFPNSDLITITTSMDPSRGNPLDEYLETEQFPFPVLLETYSTIAAQFGVSAFPFWVVTNGDGTVLYRTSGLIGSEAVDQLFTQLEQVE